MEEIVKKIDELIKVVENNGVPAWLTWVGILVPIIISIAVIVFNTFKAHEYAFSPTLMDLGSSSSKSSQILTSPSLPQVTIQL